MTHRVRARTAVAVVVVVAARAATCSAAESADPAAPKLTASVNGSYYAMRDEEDFGIVVAAINRGPFRVEARHNYEAKNATSVFAGWKLSGGADGAWSWEITPLAGALGGSERAGIAALEASVSRGAFDLYVEAEYLWHRASSDSNYFYAWSELGWKPVEWLRVGLVGQRRRVVHTDRDIQRGLFAQVIYKAATLGVYAFNPDAASRYTVVSLALAF
jgi:hypothetical protein